MNVIAAMPTGRTDLPLKICRVELGRIIGLRHRILRAGLPVNAAYFPNDTTETTWHFGAFLDSNEEAGAVGCATFMASSFENEAAWQLRGMATAQEYERRGIGRTLLAYAEQVISGDSAIRWFWCNARLPAVAFYQKQGWTTVSETFDIPTAGPHRKMIKQTATG